METNEEKDNEILKLKKEISHLNLTKQKKIMMFQKQLLIYLKKKYVQSL